MITAVGHTTKVVAVLVDNGEPTLAKSVESLRNQTVKCDIILAPGPKSDLELAKSLADVIMPPTIGIGRSRVNAILKADSDYILSCDSDTWYSQNYAEVALQNLREVNAVRAASIWPLEWTDLLTPVEMTFSLIPPYEFSYCLRKSAFLAARIHEEDYSASRGDIGPHVLWRLWPRLEWRMVCYTRFPTRGAKIAAGFVPSALMGLSPLIGVVGICTLS